MSGGRSLRLPPNVTNMSTQTDSHAQQPRGSPRTPNANRAEHTPTPKPTKRRGGWLRRRPVPPAKRFRHNDGANPAAPPRLPHRRGGRFRHAPRPTAWELGRLDSATDSPCRISRIGPYLPLTLIGGINGALSIPHYLSPQAKYAGNQRRRFRNGAPPPTHPRPRCAWIRRFRGLGAPLSRSLPVGRTNTPVGRFRRRVGFRIPNLDGPISTFRENSFLRLWQIATRFDSENARMYSFSLRSFCARQPADYALRYVPKWVTSSDLALPNG